ncbi:hypothetical protein [Nostoc sp. NMS4]|uniref:hypothetical protein n=1 Tax=Nostoc sp. NMS4 TaxID=2815390 RepID=UPI0025F72071|nr:hypothetical protein [Nostoc sp. NMS4]MBN3924025.1 hypothetical protein [Nostoc sp. NMS4]
MKIKTFHAHFSLSLGNYNSERIGFAVELDDNETPEDVVITLRERAKNIVGKKAQDYYSDKDAMQSECRALERKLQILRNQWEATATFLKAQGLNPDAPSMPDFGLLLTAVRVEAEAVAEEEEEEEYDEEEYDEN